MTTHRLVLAGSRKGPRLSVLIRGDPKARIYNAVCSGLAYFQHAIIATRYS